jgi:hypothetical protein
MTVRGGMAAEVREDGRWGAEVGCGRVWVLEVGGGWEAGRWR